MQTHYLWDDVTNTCLAEFDENGDVTVEYNVNPQSGELISERRDGEDIYHRFDGDGNTRQTADSAGNVLGKATYTAFGETVAESGDMKTTYRFRGQHGYSTDPLTGDVSRGNQEYSPSLGRNLAPRRIVSRRFNDYSVIGFRESGLMAMCIMGPVGPANRRDYRDRTWRILVPEDRFSRSRVLRVSYEKWYQFRDNLGRALIS